MKQFDIDSEVKNQVNKDIRQELGTNKIHVIKRGMTEEEANAKHNRLCHVVGIERAIKAAGIGNNSNCPCGSNAKFKKCCKPMLRNDDYPIEFIADRLKLRRDDEFIVNQIRDSILK